MTDARKLSPEDLVRQEHLKDERAPLEQSDV